MYLKKLCLTIIVIFNVWLNEINGANILYISTTPSPSHHIWDKTLAMGLKDRNHKITFLTHSEEKKIENFTPLVLEGISDKIHEEYDLGDWLYYSTIDSIVGLYDWMNTTCYYDIQSKEIKTLVIQAKSGVKYDIIIMDMTTGACLYPLIELFGNPPVIATSPYGLVQYFTFPFGIDLNIAYNPLNFLPYTDQMNIFERINNFYHVLYFIFWRNYVYFPAQQKFAEDYFGKNITPLKSVEKKFSLLLTNTDPVFDYPQSVPPAVIQVGGLHTKRAKSLPKDLQKYLDDAKHGIVLFALGTNIRADSIGKNEIKALVEAFSQLKQNVVWKYETTIPNLPKNIMIKNWLPQNDILAHPNVKLFLTHGGGLSTQEAMYHGVPVVGIPFFVDQHVNMRKMVVRKLGLQIDFQNITTTNLLKSMNEVLNNPIYKKNAMTVSKRYKDKPVDALSLAIHWIESVIRNEGAEHLKIAARDMPFYEVLMLDIFALILIVVTLTILMVKRLFCMFARWIKCGGNNSKVDMKKKKK